MSDAAYTPKDDLNQYLSPELEKDFRHELNMGYGQPKDEVDPEFGHTRVAGEYIGTDIDTQVPDDIREITGE